MTTMVREISAPETASAYEALRELRPHLESQERFLVQIAEQRAAGYRLVGVFGAGSAAEAVVGFRVHTNTAWGRHIYIDDLATRAEARRRGHARALLQWVREEAARLGISELHLDSGVGPNRQEAHRLYFADGFRISSYHFSRSVKDPVGLHD